MHLFHPPVRSMLLPVAMLALTAMLLSACTQQTDNKPRAKKNARNKSHLVEIAHVQRDTLSQARTYTGSVRARRVVRIHALE